MLEGRRNELEGASAPTPTEVHRQTIDVLSRLLEMGKGVSTEETPASLRTMLRMFERSKPLLISQLATVPPETIREFMRGIGSEINKIIDAPAIGVSAQEQEAS